MDDCYPFLLADGAAKIGTDFFVIEGDQVVRHTAESYFRDTSGSFFLVAKPERYFHLYCWNCYDHARQELVKRLREEMVRLQERQEELRVRLNLMERGSNCG